MKGLTSDLEDLIGLKIRANKKAGAWDFRNLPYRNGMRRNVHSHTLVKKATIWI
jgi:hypothetical protein